ncbi:MAG TPA: hypothetical protein VLA05_03530, partial [Coriobacteriia bacterium]|nr:hypothetical protein [Coriobacteriia bacterium]
PPSRLPMLASAAIGFVVASLLVPVMAFSRGREVSVVILAFGLAVGAILALRAWRTGVPRFYLIAASTVAFSAIMSTSETVGVQDGIGILFVFEGLLLIANGVWTLLTYLKANRAPRQGSAA